MQSYGEIRDLLVSYDPTYTKSREQAFPLESMEEPVSGGDAYYEDFTEGLRRFVASRTGSAQTKTGGSAGGVFVLTLSGGSAADVLDDPSDDELDAPDDGGDNEDNEDNDDQDGQCGCGSGRTDQSILAFQRSADEKGQAAEGGAPAGRPSVSSSTSAGKSISTAADSFGDEIRSLLAFVQNVGDSGARKGGGDREVDDDEDADDGGDSPPHTDTGTGDAYSSFVMIDADDGDDNAVGEMDESETERGARDTRDDQGAQDAQPPHETILGAVVNADRGSASSASKSD